MNKECDGRLAKERNFREAKDRERSRTKKTSIVLKLNVAELFLCGIVIDPCNKSVFESFLMNEPT